MTNHSKQAEPVVAEVRRAFAAWMKGEPFIALARLVPHLRQADFKKLAGVDRWKQAVAKRDAALRAQKRGAA